MKIQKIIKRVILVVEKEWSWMVGQVVGKAVLKIAFNNQKEGNEDKKETNTHTKKDINQKKSSLLGKPEAIDTDKSSKS